MSSMIALPTVIPAKATQTFADGNYAVPVTVAAIPDGYIKPSGILAVNEDGNFDVKKFANAAVRVGRKFQQGSFTLTSGVRSYNFYIDFEPAVFCLIETKYSTNTTYRVLGSLWTKGPAKTLYYNATCSYNADGEYSYDTGNKILTWRGINDGDRPALGRSMTYKWFAIA
ncbi:MAG: hypothetical protein IJ766_03990 [Clostridia bacterium]|nr:hypothetical protein [Clostridia bacterium]